jgi:hypothetical protein
MLRLWLTLSKARKEENHFGVVYQGDRFLAEDSTFSGRVPEKRA